MRILIVVCDLGRGGVQRGARNFAHGFSELGHEVVVLTTAADGDQEPSPSGQTRVVSLREEDDRLPQGVLDFEPDAVQVHAHLLRWEVVGWLRTTFPDAVFVEQSVWSRWMPSTDHVDAICYQSPWMASVFQARTRFRRKRPLEFVLGLPVEVHAFGADDGPTGALEFRQRWGIPAGAVVLGRLGQAFGDKWHTCLVTTFLELAPRHPNLFLLVVAAPDNVKRAIRNLPKHLQQRTLIIDWLDGDGELARAYSSIDIFGHAARRGESFGFVLVEALASATPVVTLSTPYQDNAQVDWIAQSGAGIVAGSPSAFTDAVERLVHDEAARTTMGRLGPPYVDRFRTETICSEFINLVERLDGVERYPTRVRSEMHRKYEPWGSLQQAGLEIPRSLRFALTVRPFMSWFYKGDRLWTEGLRWWLERRVWPHEQRAQPPAVSAGTQSGGSASGRNLGVIIPTYHRDSPLEATLNKLAKQSVLPKEVVVVDNANSRSCRQQCVNMASMLPYELTYLPSSVNGGPAGASSLGIGHFLGGSDDIDWIVRGDDDSPDVRRDFFEGLLDAADEARSRTTALGGVGGSGAVYNRRTGQLSKPPHHPSGLCPVDYLATNYYPLFSRDAVRVVGGFRDDLFFGHDEVEFGLRLRAAGYELFRWDTPDFVRRSLRPSHRLDPPSWRRYYGLRNQIVVAREHATLLAAVRLTLVSLLKPIFNFPRGPHLALSNLSLALRANRDAYFGRLGKTVEPSMVAGELDYRSAK